MGSVVGLGSVMGLGLGRLMGSLVGSGLELGLGVRLGSGLGWRRTPPVRLSCRSSGQCYQ